MIFLSRVLLFKFALKERFLSSVWKTNLKENEIWNDSFYFSVTAIYMNFEYIEINKTSLKIYWSDLVVKWCYYR